MMLRRCGQHQLKQYAWRRHAARALATPVLPTEMKALVWRGDADPSKMKVETLLTPKPKKDEVLVKVKAAGVCHTDLHCIKGEVPFPTPAVFGHEMSGEVVACGEGVDIPLGTKVVSPFIMPCGTCSFCEAGEEDTCEPFFSLNRLKGHLYDDTTRLFKSDGEEVAMYSFGGLAEYSVVPKTAVFALPENLANNFYEESSILGCAFFTAFGAIRNAAHLEPHHSVAIIGCGGVGGGLIQLLRHMGVSPIIAVDVSEGALEQAKQLGATHTINSGQEPAVEKIAEITGGRKVDVAFEVIGLKPTFEQAVMSVRDGGKACYIGISDVKTKAEVPITHIVRRRISLVGSYGARASQDMPALLDIAADGGIDLKHAITRRFTLDESPAAYGLLNDRKIVGRAIVNMF
eukprot:TRINITY_DN101066_c0_g1_i1.p1 TRINITY_DN101066_c0_g1~~TRINITY_DN101066_c0_g1_i1.p1  ORF type:complete len:403 (-),score=108.69 TRINITY_DN101066_c0_g1_i1:267-1475(-)